MKQKIIILIILILQFFFIYANCPRDVQKQEESSENAFRCNPGNPNCSFLPDNYPVYASEGRVVNNPVSGWTKRNLPTVSSFREYPGCYIACYSKKKEGAAYGVGGGIYTMGQLRVPGKYYGRVCHPTGYYDLDISASDIFKDKCNTTFPQICDQGCWAGGDTGGWFGIQ